MKVTVIVAQRVLVEVDRKKFTKKFMAEFRESFYNFTTVQEHCEHLAQLYARGLVDELEPIFIEGYGNPKDFGIRFKILDCETDSVLS